MENSSTATVSGHWAKYLKKDEEILWQGRPSGRVHMRRGDVSRIIGGVLVMVVCILMAAGGYAIAAPISGLKIVFLIFYWSFLLGLFIYALYMAVFQFYFTAVTRRKTHYAITNQRAMALVTGNKEKFEDGVLDGSTNLDYVPGDLASIYYKKTAKRKLQNISNKHGHGSGPRRDKSSYSTEYIYQGFELIPDGANAYQTMLGVQGAKLAKSVPAKAGNSGEAWQDFLLQGEELLWQGAPATGPRPTKAGVIATVIGLLFLFYFGPIALRALSADIEEPGVLAIGGFAAVMSVLGLWLAVGHWLLDIRKRKAIRYALTNQRAFVASALAGRKMLTFALTADYRPLLIKGQMDMVTFGEEDWFDGDGNKTKRPIAFEFLKDGKEVYDHLTKISIRLEDAAETT